MIATDMVKKLLGVDAPQLVGMDARVYYAMQHGKQYSYQDLAEQTGLLAVQLIPALHRIKKKGFADFEKVGGNACLWRRVR